MYVEVALPVSLYQTFIYKLDRELDKDSVVGRRVLVDFRNKRYYGFVVDAYDNAPENLEVKDILYMDEYNTFTKTEIEIIKSISDYYISPIGLTIYYFIPNYLKGKDVEDDMITKIYRINEDMPNIKKLSASQEKLINLITQLSEVSFMQLKLFGFKKTTVESLVKLGILTEYKFSKVAHILKQEEIPKTDYQKITKQINLLSFLSDRERFYKLYEIIKRANESGDSVLIVFPSIQALNKYYQALSIYFNNIKIYHDALPAKKQLLIWKSSQKENSIVLGSLSSLLMPIKNLKYIFVELEHSENYRSLIRPKFDTKRVVYLVGRYKSASIVYNDRLPSLETYLLAKNRKAKILTNPIDTNKKIEIIKFEGLQKTLKTLERILKTSGQTLIIANKSYYASFVYCERCGFELLCNSTAAPLQVIKKGREKILKCPECNKIYEYPPNCPNCGNYLTERGFGRERIFSYLKHLTDISLYEEEKDTQVKIVSSIQGKFFFDRYDTIINIYPDFIKNLDRYDSQELFFRSVIEPLYIDSDRYILFTNIPKDSNLCKAIYTPKDIHSLYEEEINFRKKYSYPPIKKYIKFEFFAKKKHHTNTVVEFIRKEYKKNEIFFEFLDEYYYKVILDTNNKTPLKVAYEKFSRFGRINIEVNTKNI